MFSRVCKVKDHEQKPIEFACIYPKCNFSRFLCSKCLRVGTHRHQQSDQTHILDSKELLECLKDKIIKQQYGNPQNKNINRHIDFLKKMQSEIQTILIQLLNIIKAMEQSILSNRDKQLDDILQRLENYGFNQINDNDLNNLIKIHQNAGDIYKQLAKQSHPIFENLTRIQEYCHSLINDYSGLEQKIKYAKCQLITKDQLKDEFRIYSSAISNDSKYIASGGSDKMVKIWNYENNTLIKSIQIDECFTIKFTDDSKFLYVGQYRYLHQLDINDQCKETYKQAIHSNDITTIFCITNSLILTSSNDKSIIKTDTNLKQQIFVIQAHNDIIFGLDYNGSLNIIASASNDKAIKLWDGINGEFIIEKQNACMDEEAIFSILFINRMNQLISLVYKTKIVVWKIRFEEKKLEQIQIITNNNIICNISLVLDQQYITLICEEYIKIYSIKGKYIRSINHGVKEFYMFRTIQPQSMKAMIVQGKSNNYIIETLQICKINLD